MTAALHIASSADAPADTSRAGVHQRLRQILAKLCDDALEAPLDRNLAATFDWEPLLSGRAEIDQVLDVGRSDAGNNFAVAVILASFTAEKMREYAESLGIEGVENVLETMIEYRGRVESLLTMLDCGTARMFAAANEVLGTGAAPSLSLVKG
jgi:hypothetical protein